jgi:hypothetical protein
MAIGALGFFSSGGGLIFPAIVAWATGSLFALGRRPRYLWLQVAAIGVVVAARHVTIAVLRTLARSLASQPDPDPEKNAKDTRARSSSGGVPN